MNLNYCQLCKTPWDNHSAACTMPRVETSPAIPDGWYVLVGKYDAVTGSHKVAAVRPDGTIVEIDWPPQGVIQ